MFVCCPRSARVVPSTHLDGCPEARSYGWHRATGPATSETPLSVVLYVPRHRASV